MLLPVMVRIFACMAYLNLPTRHSVDLKAPRGEERRELGVVGYTVNKGGSFILCP